MTQFMNSQEIQKGWRGGLPETPCGYGSTLEATEKQRVWIPQMIKRYKIKTVADIGAGDLNWIRKTKLPKSVQYTPYDLFPRDPSVQKFDLLKQIPPASDLLMCLWVLNHMDKETCRTALANLKASGSKYLMITDRPGWHHEQPKEIQMPFLEELNLTAKGDRLILCQI